MVKECLALEGRSCSEVVEAGDYVVLVALERSHLTGVKRLAGGQDKVGSITAFYHLQHITYTQQPILGFKQAIRLLDFCERDVPYGYLRRGTQHALVQKCQFVIFFSPDYLGSFVLGDRSLERGSRHLVCSTS